MSTYKSIPVHIARKIAEQCDKSQVIIVAWDAAHQLVNATTYGVSPEDKAQAARLGDELRVFLGLDMSRKRCDEDFREVEKGEWAAQKELLVAACKKFARWIREGQPATTQNVLSDVEAALQMVGTTP